MLSLCNLVAVFGRGDTLFGFPGSSAVKNLPASAGDTGLKILWRRKWQPTPVFLPGEFHGQRSLVGYSPGGHKESDMTERLHFHFIGTCAELKGETAVPYFSI